MKINLIDESEIILSNPDSKHNYFGWPTVAKLKNGTIVAGASGYRLAHVCPFGKAVLAYSFDGGKTYTAPAPVIDTPLDDRDAGLCVFGESGLIVTSFNNKRELQREHLDFNGRSEKCQRYVGAYLDNITDEDEEKYLGSLYRVSYDNGMTFGPIYKSPVTSPHGPTELNDGTILWVGNAFEADSECKSQIEAHKINPDGTSEFVGKIENVTHNGKPVSFYEPHAFCLKNGRIIAHMRAEQPNAMFTTYQSVSEDKGKTWSTPVCIMPEKGGAPAHIMQHSSGLLICSYSYRGCLPNWELPYGIRLAFSKDNGETWDYGYEIFTTDALWDMGYPSTVELEDGSLLTVFYAHPDQNGPAVIYQQKWSFED